jgi:cell division septation protein DedD
LGLSESSEQKKFSMIQILIYLVVFLLAGYLSYTFIISTEVKKLQSARVEYKKEKIILKALEEKAQGINALANNAQKLEAELINIRSRVFNEDNDVLSFMRTLPATVSMTGNNLMSMTPLELKPILGAPAPAPPPSSGAVEGKIAPAQSATPAPQNLSCKLKPIDISFTGGYGDVIRFFDELKRLGQYMTVDNISLGGGSENGGQVSVKVVLNLLQMEVDVRTPPRQIAEITRKASGSTRTTLVSLNKTAGVPNVNIATPVQTPAQTTAIKPVQIAKLPQPVVKPVQTIASAPSSQTAKPAVLAVKSIPKVTPVQITKQPQSVVKPVQTIASAPSSQTAKPAVLAVKSIPKVGSTLPIQTAKQNGNSIMQYAVRVGIFSYYENADNLTKTLKSHQYNAWIKPHSYSGKTTYWVYVGSFETKAKATNFAESMQQKLSYIDDFVIMDVKAGIRRNY